MQDLAAKAEKASGRGDHAAAARYYGALLKAAPTVAFAPREMCVELEAAGDLGKAIMACRTTITGLGSTAGDFVRFVSLVLASKEPLLPEERTELDTVIAHLQHESQLGALPTMLRCEVDLAVQGLRRAGGLHDGARQEGARRSEDDLVPVGDRASKARSRAGARSSSIAPAAWG